MAKFIDSSPSINNSTKQSYCVRLSEPHHGPALFLLHGTFGEVGIYTHLVDTGRLPSVTVYGVNVNKDFYSSQMDLNFSLIVNSAIQSIRDQQPSAPYLLAGYSFGGVLAYEVACELSRQGEEVAFCGVIDSFLPYRYRYPNSITRYCSIVTNFPRWFLDALINNQLLRNLRRHKRRANSISRRVGNPSIGDQAFKKLVYGMLMACDNHTPTPSRQTLWIYRSEVCPLLHSHSIERQWKEATGANVRCTNLPGNHTTIMTPPYVNALADALRDDITAVLRGEGYPQEAR